MLNVVLLFLRSLANGPLVDIISSGPGQVCDHVQGMSRNQKLLCGRYHDHMKYVSEGARNGIDECQWQFRDHRWNCTVNEDSTVFGKVLNIGKYLRVLITKFLSYNYFVYSKAL